MIVENAFDSSTGYSAVHYFHFAGVLLPFPAHMSVKSVQSALSDLKRLPERLQSQCNYRPFIT